MNLNLLKKAPFHLDEKQLQWVSTTIQSMSLEEKIGQLFFPVGFSTKEQDIINIVNNIHPGGMMYRPSKADKTIKAHRLLQSTTKIPMFLAANIEAGGNGIIDEGTFYGNNMQVGASNNVENAYRLGKISNDEGSLVGCNMAFAPVIDINMNFRNPVINTRGFSDQAELVAKMGAAYVKGAHEANCAVTIKHFPGDGTDGRDQHLLTTHNHLSYDEWMSTFGLAYKTSIEAGARGLMVGHIGFPKYFEKYSEGKTDYEFKPATLNKYLLNDLLRKELGYNGLTMTDATLMTGFGQQGKRKDLVPLSIASGCDMFLFNRSVEEDFQFMIDGYNNGILTEERLEEALIRILGLKASMGLHTKSLDELVPPIFKTDILEKHKIWSKELADESVTLVRDTQHILPLNTISHKSIGVIFNGNESGMDAVFKNIPGFKGFTIRSLMKLSGLFGNKKYTHTERFVKKLKEQGFDAFEYEFGDIFKIMKESSKSLKEWTSQFDVIILFTKWETQSNQTSLQVQYKAMGFDAPWFVKEVPTILVNVANPYQGYDFPMVETMINGYSPKDDVYDSIIEKMMGKSPFKGFSPVNLDFNEFRPK